MSSASSRCIADTQRAASLHSPAALRAQEGRALEPAELQRLAQHLDVSELLALFVHPRLALGLSERDFTEVPRARPPGLPAGVHKAALQARPPWRDSLAGPELAPSGHKQARSVVEHAESQGIAGRL